VADPGGAILPCSPSCLSVGLGPQPAKNFVWTDVHWTIYGTYQGNIHVGLPNLLTSDVYSGVKMVKIVGGRGSASSPAGVLIVLPSLLAGLRRWYGILDFNVPLDTV